MAILVEEDGLVAISELSAVRRLSYLEISRSVAKCAILLVHVDLSCICVLIRSVVNVTMLSFQIN